ncbi:LuxR family two component transcriptional regulator [Anseongella ginsenosidimutans]|uniref:LuxR family two component transcriptional regulator n=1 Tax=Anseongella ginsenosidimutans TaxID=496056 RepID=A0A4V2UTY2_9SPHI|nr:response regulator transcription factor [Anseongella ginsenosidimutans]QEC53330.1 response regulator transcription factor [Anseongella ginsenosidimutans]TCS88212.1 LuxR family two component transcriptional regulator [Anseongella ginsenosidimutans]
MKIKITIVDDQLLFRKGMKELLKSYEELEIIGEAGNGRQFIDSLNNAGVLPHLVLLDLNMPVLDGMETTKILRAEFPDIRIIVLSVHKEESYMAHLVELGAHGYLLKDAEPEEVRKAINSVYENGFYINEGLLRAIQNTLKNREKGFESIHPSTFTARELEVLELICREFTTAEIAEKLFISIKTVNGHRDNLLRKAQVRNMAGLVVYALKYNIVTIY